MADPNDLSSLLELPEDPSEASASEPSLGPASDSDVASGDLTGLDFLSAQTPTDGNDPAGPELEVGSLAPPIEQVNEFQGLSELGDIPGFEEVPASPSEPSPASAPDPINPMESVKQFAEQAPVGKPVLEASLPFSLRILGTLAPNEQEKLLDVLSREEVGVRQVDLEPQLASGKILIPRISEFAGILIVQALRGTRAQIELGPSDSIFSTEETRTPESTRIPSAREEMSITSTLEASHPAETIPLTSGSSLRDFREYIVIDTVTASAALKTHVVEAERSEIYQSVLEALQREVKYKAYRKGAQAVVNLKIELTPLSIPSRYRVLVSGTAVRQRGRPDSGSA